MVDEKYLLDQFQSLSVDEMEVMKLVAEGWSTGYIMRVMFLAPKTLSNRLTLIYSKLGLDGLKDVNNRVLSTLMYQKWDLLRKA